MLKCQWGEFLQFISSLSSHTFVKYDTTNSWGILLTHDPMIECRDTSTIVNSGCKRESLKDVQLTK